MSLKDRFGLVGGDFTANEAELTFEHRTPRESTLTWIQLAGMDPFDGEVRTRAVAGGAGFPEG